MISLLLTIILVVCIGWGAIWILGKLAPGHPGIIDNIIWVLVVVFMVLIVASATGILQHDIPVPRLR
jgi:hypothetical protein